MDIHILKMGEPANWITRCKRSLPKDHEIHVCQGIDAQIGKARIRGFSKGTSPFVSFADPDDVYEKSVFGKLEELLNKNPEFSFAYSGETRGDKKEVFNETYDVEKHFKSALHVHGVVVFRRELIEKTSSRIECFMRRFEIYALTLLMLQFGPPIQLKLIGRNWSLHEDNAHDYCIPDDLFNLLNVRSYAIRMLPRFGRKSALVVD